MRLLIEDSNYLSRLCHPRPYRRLSQWIQEKLEKDREFVVVIPEIVDYEVRRGFLLKSRYESDPTKKAAFERSLVNLDKLVTRWPRRTTSREILLRAAELWARARGEHYQTAHEERLDIDVIVAAHALAEAAPVLTNNTKHFHRFSITVVDPAPPP